MREKGAKGITKKEALNMALDFGVLLVLVVGFTMALKMPDYTVEVPVKVLLLLAFASMVVIDRFRMAIYSLEHTLSRLEESNKGEEDESGLVDIVY